jgi:uncharacterized alpha-E superfamily protein
MLARIAESLYWIGRYCERAEDTARLLDVHYHVLLEDRTVDEAAACQALLDAMGVPEDALDVEANAAEVTMLLTHDLAYSGSIASSIEAAWENARGAREAISSELWEALNTTHRSMKVRSRATTGRARHELFDWVKERTAMLAGVADSTMSHDDGWHFLLAGRNLERVDMTTRLLSARYGESWGPPGWTTTLRCCSAYEAYLRTYRKPVDASSAVEFLLLDRLFPRSVYHSLTAAEDRLGELAPISARAGVDDDASRLLGRARAELEFLRVEEVIDELPSLLVKLQQDCTKVHAAIGERYFQETRVVEWSV